MDSFALSQSQPSDRSQIPQSGSVGQVIACLRCRKQKLRCTREKPTCKRCKDVFSSCEYPLAPDRKLLAAQRIQNAKLRNLQRHAEEAAPTAAGAQKEHGKSTSENHSGVSKVASPQESVLRNKVSIQELPVLSDRHMRELQSVPREPPNGDFSLNESCLITTPPSPGVARFLIEVYFSHLYNAALLFHKESLISDYFADRVPEFVSLTIFAAASIFLRASPRHLHLDGYVAEPEVSTLAIVACSRYSHEWATVAGRRVLMQADEPRLETVQACQNLALYWFSLDLKDRTNVYTHLAYRTCRLLGLHISPTSGFEIDRIYGEIKKRCFWSSWITNCISQENAGFKCESWREAVGLQFPCDEASFKNGAPRSNESFDDTGNIVSLDGGSRIPQTSIMGEYVKLYSLWWEIQHFVKANASGRSKNFKNRISTLLTLDRQLELVSENFHPSFQYRNSASFKSPALDPYNLFLLHCLHQLCCCVLHSSIVPIFSNTPVDLHISKKLIKMSAEQAVTHSMNTLTMTTTFLNIQRDKSRIPSIVGYAMFVACSIQFKSASAQGKLRAYGTGHFTAAISVLEQLKEHWNPLRGLWIQLETTFRSAGIGLNTLSTNRSQAQPVISETQTDFERIASQDVSKQSGVSDLYTYVVGQEPKPAEVALLGSPQDDTRQTITTRNPVNKPSTQPPSATFHHNDVLQEHNAEPNSSLISRSSGPITGQSTTETFAQSKLDESILQARYPLPSGIYSPYEKPLNPFSHNAHNRQQRPIMRNAEASSMDEPRTEEYQMQAEQSNGVPNMTLSPATGVPSQVQMVEGYGSIDPPPAMSEMIIDSNNAWWDHSAETVGPGPLNFLLGGYQGNENWAYFLPTG